MFANIRTNVIMTIVIISPSFSLFIYYTNSCILIFCHNRDFQALVAKKNKTLEPAMQSELRGFWNSCKCRRIDRTVGHDATVRLESTRRYAYGNNTILEEYLFIVFD